MKANILGGAALAAATVSLALSGAVPAQAKGKHQAARPAAEKHNCGGKNGCPGMSKGDDKAAAEKPADAKPAEAVRAEPAKTESATPEGGKPADGK
ncbi:MAG: hypothetical protein ACR652_25810 [Methylocystis sp.]|uniref:hypothetical protein n=1 Tax=Methylocystis sp. TaxID=1911079 RepID=UPI003DA518C9